MMDNVYEVENKGLKRPATDRPKWVNASDGQNYKLGSCIFSNDFNTQTNKKKKRTIYLPNTNQ